MKSWRNVLVRPQTAARYDSLWDSLDLRKDSGERYDANDLAILTRQAEFVRGKVFEVKMASLLALGFVPLATDIPSWATNVVEIVYDSAGQATIVGNGSDDVRRTDVIASEQYSKIFSLAASYGFSLMDIRTALGTGVPLQERKGLVARRVIDTAVDEIIATGKLASAGQNNTGLTGLMNAAAVPIVASSAGSWATAITTDAGKANIIQEVNSLIVTPSQATKQIFATSQVVMAPQKYDLLALTPRSSVSDTTLLEYLKIVNPGVQFDKWHRLTAAGAGGKDRTLAYAKTSEVLEGILPLQFEQLPPQIKNFDTIILCHARCGGVNIHHPNAMAYMDPTS